jgi:NADH-quinone oxidoreductase subunit C
MLDQFLSVITPVCGNAPVVDELCSPTGIKISADDLLPVMDALYRSPATYFDVLSCVTGVDNGVEARSMEIAYNLYSIPFDYRLMVKILLNRDKPEIESVSHIWKTANWHEREIFDMYGVYFKNHPDLRRILMPSDWEGHPLRKDYKQQQYYRDIKIDY